MSINLRPLTPQWNVKAGSGNITWLLLAQKDLRFYRTRNLTFLLVVKHTCIIRASVEHQKLIGPYLSKLRRDSIGADFQSVYKLTN